MENGQICMKNSNCVKIGSTRYENCSMESCSIDKKIDLFPKLIPHFVLLLAPSWRDTLSESSLVNQI